MGAPHSYGGRRMDGEVRIVRTDRVFAGERELHGRWSFWCWLSQGGGKGTAGTELTAWHGMALHCMGVVLGGPALVFSYHCIALHLSVDIRIADTLFANLLYLGVDMC